jgi:hypothetical protein
MRAGAGLAMAGAVGLLLLPGCHAGEAEPGHPQVATAQNGSAPSPAEPGAAAPSADVQRLQSDAKQDQRVLDEANGALRALGR